MFEIGMYEAKTHFPEIMRRVEKGEDYVITRRGKPVGKIVPMEPGKKEIGKAWRKYREYCKAHPINATFEEMMAWKNEGRR